MIRIVPLSLPAILLATSASVADDITVMKGRLYDHFLAEGAAAAGAIEGYLSTQSADGQAARGS